MDDRSSQIMGVCILFFALSWITVLLRIYVRSDSFSETFTTSNFRKGLV